MKALTGLQEILYRAVGFAGQFGFGNYKHAYASGREIWIQQCARSTCHHRQRQGIKEAGQVGPAMNRSEASPNFDRQGCTRQWLRANFTSALMPFAI
jgi:hypothetical protein